jgi:ketosteroid isomerase-like protein
MATNREIIEGAYASFAQGDVPAVLGAFADDIQWIEPDGYPLGGTYVGHQAVVDGVFMRLGEIGNDFAVMPEQFVADRDTVVALGHLSWRHKSTGKPAAVKTAHVWTFERGKAATFEQLIDTVQVRELSG